MRYLIKSWLIFILAALFSSYASAVPVEIDRTRRTIDIPAECQANMPVFNDASYNNAGIVLNHVDARFTFTLSTTERLRLRVNPASIGNELSWFHFVNSNGNTDRDAGLDNQQKFRRAVILARCGLPWTLNDNRLYQYPAAQNTLNNFLIFAMGQGGMDPRTASGYTLVGNGEREAILMYAAQQIKMDLTPTIFAQGVVCVLYGNAENRSGCTSSTAAAVPQDTIVGYLYEGINRVSYTGHEFWMMYANPAFRNKVYFTEGTRFSNGANVDNFLAWNGAPARWNDPAGNRTSFAPAPYRFQDLVDGNNNRTFYQDVMPAFQTRYNQRVLAYRQW